MSERSEFVRRALFGEKRKAPMQSIGKRPGKMVLGTFAKTKVPRQQAKNIFRDEGFFKFSLLFKTSGKATSRDAFPRRSVGTSGYFQPRIIATQSWMQDITTTSLFPLELSSKPHSG